MSTAVNANVRVLELFVELLGARPGRTKAQLRALPGYQGLADDAFETQFQRDKDALRDAGAHMTIHSGERYSIAWDSFAPGIEVTSTDRALMSLAARAWDSSEFFADAIDAKAAAASSDDVSAPTIRLGLTGLGAATALAQAIRERRVVCFEYPGSPSSRGPCRSRAAPCTCGDGTSIAAASVHSVCRAFAPRFRSSGNREMHRSRPREQRFRVCHRSSLPSSTCVGTALHARFSMVTRPGQHLRSTVRLGMAGSASRSKAQNWERGWVVFFPWHLTWSSYHPSPCATRC